MRLADGLIVRRISLGQREVVVVKQTANEAFHFFELNEWELLSRLNQPGIGFNAANEIDEEEMKSFYQSAAQEGLIADHPNSVSPTQSTKPPWYASPFAIRLPGLDPSNTLASMIRVLDQLGRSRLKWTAIAIVSLALVVAVLNLPALISDSASATSRVFASPNQGWLVFVVALALVKISHELAHGLACHGGGGRCREMGVMILFGVPCLYCDVSDTWLMPSRRHRMLVSAAGMLAEFLIASIAVLIWSVTYQGFIHDLMAMIVVVASVSTLVVNANPLLRYDGYFILSDWIGVPNLGSHANEAFRNLVNQNDDEPKQYGLAAYAIASGIYRVFVIGLIVWFTCGIFLKWVGVGLAIPVAMWIGWSVMRRLIFVEVASMSPRLTFGFAAALMAFVLWVPLPQSVRVGGLIRPSRELSIYAPTTGRLRCSQGEIEVVSWQQRLDWLSAQGEADEFETELRSRQVDRLQDASLGTTLPLMRQRVRTASEKANTLLLRIAESKFVISNGDQLFEPSSVRLSQNESNDHRELWTGIPTSPTNSGVTIEKGTLLGRTGDAQSRIVSAYVPDEHIDSIGIGTVATIGLSSYSSGSIRGTVIEIATDPVDDLPPEIVASGWVPNDSASERQFKPATTHYEVTIEIESLTNLPVRLVAPIRMKLPARSMGSRLLNQWRSTLTLSI